MFRRSISYPSHDTTVSRVNGRELIDHGVESRADNLLRIILQYRVHGVTFKLLLERMQRIGPGYIASDVRTALNKLRDENLVIRQGHTYQAVIGARNRWDQAEKLYVGENTALHNMQRRNIRRAG